MELLRRLECREAEGTPIRVGLVGAGHMGSGFVHVTHKMPGMSTVALADIAVDRARAVFQELGVPVDDVCVTSLLSEAEDALRRGKRVVTEDAVLLTRLESLDAVVEATGVTEVGAQVAWSGVLNSKHVIMLNVETDVTVGLFLHRMAQKTGCVYTVASGDEPGVCKGLYDFGRSLGFEVVCLGKGKNNPLDYRATSASCREEAEARGMSPKMLAAFKDGTKTMVEMAAASSATGLVPDVAGMHGPKADVADLAKVFVPQADGGILSRRGCVDFSTGKVAPGVFAIVTSDAPRVRADMAFLSMGEGPYYSLYRPYHLCNIETPISVAEAVLYGETTVVPQAMVSEVITVAKRALRAGERVGDIGGADFYGRIATYAEAKAQRCVPIGLATNGTVLAPVAEGGLLTGDNFCPDASRFVYTLRQMQDAMLAMGS